MHALHDEARPSLDAARTAKAPRGLATQHEAQIFCILRILSWFYVRLSCFGHRRVSLSSPRLPETGGTSDSCLGPGRKACLVTPLRRANSSRVVVPRVCSFTTVHTGAHHERIH